MPSGTPLADDPLDLWRSIAELSPRALPEPGFARRDVTIKDYLRDHRFPWDPVTGHRDGRGTWRHTVFAGLLPYRTLLVRAGLAFDADGARTGAGPSSRDDRADAAGRPGTAPGGAGRPGTAPGGAAPYRIPSSDLTPLLALQVDQDGVVDVDTLAVSRACWAALALSGFGRAVTDFRSDSRTWREAMLGTLRARGVRLSDGSGGGSRALERADLVELVEETHRVFEAGALRSERIVNSPVRVASLRTDGPTARIPALPLIDHPAAAALDEAARGSRFRQAAAGLLGIEAPEVREDVATAPRLMYSGVAPRQLPLGVAEAEGASVATQFSVNRALAELGGAEGLWSVPASLVHGVDPARARRMLVAALLTRRGRALADLPDPAEAFDPEPAASAGHRSVHALHPDLAGFGVVRASPLERVLAGRGGFGARVSLLPGMEETGLYPGLVPGEAVDAVDAVDAVLGALEDREGAPSPAEYEEWDRLAARVVESQDRVEALLAARQRCHEVVPMLMRAQNTISRTARQLSGVRGTEQALEEELRAAEAEHRAAWDRTSELSDVIAAHLGAAPGVVRRTVTLGRAGPPWRARLEELRDRRAEAQRTEESSRARRDALQRELSRARTDAEALREELHESAATVRSLQDELAAYPHRRHAVDQEWLAGDWQEDTASAPWLDAEVQAARVEAYRSAARLHGLVLRLQAAEIRAGLLLARELLGAGAEQAPDAAAAGGDPAPEGTATGRDAAPDAAPTGGNTAPEAAAAAWETLLAVFPEVDVPVELLPRMLAPLGRHRLDWLIVTEADRVGPGVAYAALRGTRRAVMLPSPEAGRRRARGPADGRREAAGSGRGTERGTAPGPVPGTAPDAGAPFEQPTADVPRTVLYHVPPETAQKRLAEIAECSPDWAPAWTDALSLARRQSRYSA